MSEHAEKMLIERKTIKMTKAQVLNLWNIVVDQESDTLIEIVDVDNYGTVTVGTWPFAWDRVGPRDLFKLWVQGGYQQVDRSVPQRAAEAVDRAAVSDPGSGTGA